jgi:hypothetical protein
MYGIIDTLPQVLMKTIFGNMLNQSPAFALLIFLPNQLVIRNTLIHFKPGALKVAKEVNSNKKAINILQNYRPF